MQKVDRVQGPVNKYVIGINSIEYAGLRGVIEDAGAPPGGARTGRRPDRGNLPARTRYWGSRRTRTDRKGVCRGGPESRTFGTETSPVAVLAALVADSLHTNP